MITTQTVTTAPTRFYLKETDLELLKWLAEYHHLQPLHFQKLSGRNIISLRRRLRQLHQHGYVERLTVPLERAMPVASPPDQYVYYLGQRGLTLAKQYGLADEAHRYNPEKSVMLLPHDLLITTFHLALHLASQNANGNPQILFWEQRRALLQDRAYDRGEPLSVNPDAFFGIKDTTKPEGENCTYFFLEVVRAREHDYLREESSFMRKMRGFLAYHRDGGHQRRWKVSNFRVVTVAPTRARASNLCRKMTDAGLSFKRFWFTDLSEISLDQPERILSRIFLTPKDHTSGPLYSFRD